MVPQFPRDLFSLGTVLALRRLRCAEGGNVLIGGCVRRRDCLLWLKRGSGESEGCL